MGTWKKGEPFVIDFSGKDLVIIGPESGQGSAVFDGKNINGTSFFHCGASGGSLEVQRITMKRGNEKIGGCISAISTINKIMLKINECTFETNEAGSGGAIFIKGNEVDLQVHSSTFVSNAGGAGGAIYADRGSAKIYGSTFTANNGGLKTGGAIYVKRAIFMIETTCDFTLQPDTSAGHNDIQRDAGEVTFKCPNGTHGQYVMKETRRSIDKLPPTYAVVNCTDKPPTHAPTAAPTAAPTKAPTIKPPPAPSKPSKHGNKKAQGSKTGLVVGMLFLVAFVLGLGKIAYDRKRNADSEDGRDKHYWNDRLLAKEDEEDDVEHGFAPAPEATTQQRPTEAASKPVLKPKPKAAVKRADHGLGPPPGIETAVAFAVRVGALPSATGGTPDPEISTSNVGKYTIGQHMNKVGPNKVSGFISKIVPDMPGAVSGPGRLVISDQEPASASGGDGEVLGKVSTSNIAKYSVGQRVDKLGPLALSGYISTIVPKSFGATSGQGLLVITAQVPESDAVDDDGDGYGDDDDDYDNNDDDADDAADGSDSGFDKVTTSNVGKYTIGQHMNKVGPNKVSGFISKIVPDMPGATSGGGVLMISDQEPDDDNSEGSGEQRV
jgi:hypothetical protein